MIRAEPKVTVAIFNYNGIEDTDKCLGSLMKTKYINFEIWVLDDGSKQDEILLLKKRFKALKIKFFKDGANLGFCRRVNQVLSASESKYVVLLNNDTVVDPYWLKEIVDVAEADPKTGICQSKLRWMSHPEYFEYAGACGGYLDKLGFPYTRGRVMFTIEKDVGQYDKVAEIFWSCGAAMLIKREVTKGAGFFDESFFAYQEEIDFCWRVKKLGYKIKIAPKSLVFHKGTGFWSKQLTKKTFLVHRNNLILLVKHLPFKELIWIFPIRILMDYLSIIYYLQRRQFSYALAVIRAHLGVIKSLSRIVKKRSGGYNPERKPFSIVWNSFILKKRTYSDVFSYNMVKGETLNYEDLFTKEKNN